MYKNNIIDKELIEYCQTVIIPKYKTLDLAHQPNHVNDVIEKSIQIATEYEVDLNMVYTIACFHDLGNLVNRQEHHVIGGEMLASDEYIKRRFKKEEILMMSQAVEDHRASSKTPPRSIYGRIIAEADRLIDVDQIIIRSLQFSYKESHMLNFEEIYQGVREHMETKYGRSGYLKLWLNTRSNMDRLEELRRVLEDEKSFKERCKYHYQNSLHK